MLLTKCPACGTEDIELWQGIHDSSTCPDCKTKSANILWKECYKDSHPGRKTTDERDDDLDNKKYKCPACGKAKGYKQLFCADCQMTKTNREHDPVQHVKAGSLRGQFMEQKMLEWQKKIDAMSPFDFWFERHYLHPTDDNRDLLEEAFDAGRNHEEYG